MISVIRKIGTGKVKDIEYIQKIESNSTGQESTNDRSGQDSESSSSSDVEIEVLKGKVSNYVTL